MGLLYAFPVSLEETDFAKLENNQLILKTYGLPYIFWGYAMAVIIVIGFMFLAIQEPVLKLIKLGDETDALLGFSLLSFIALLPLIILSFFFYEKRIICGNGKIRMEHRILGMKFFSESFVPAKDEPLSVGPYLSSPNIARMRATEESTGFQNKGYFILWLKTERGEKIALDRHSRKADLIKLSELIVHAQT